MGHKILLADDSITIQKVIELTFSDEDFELHTVGNGQKAIDEIRSIQPDIVLCDIIMPEKNGYEVCEFIKSTDELKHIPVLLLTGAFEPFDQERAKAAGCEGFLAKPFEPQTLISKVKELLAGSQGAAASPSAAAPPPPEPPAPAPMQPEPMMPREESDETVMVPPPSMGEQPPSFGGPQVPAAPTPPPPEQQEQPSSGLDEQFAVEAGERELAMDPGDHTMLLGSNDSSNVPAPPTPAPSAPDDIWSDVSAAPPEPPPPTPAPEQDDGATVFMAEPPPMAPPGGPVDNEMSVSGDDPDATWQVPQEEAPPPPAPPASTGEDFGGFEEFAAPEPPPPQSEPAQPEPPPLEMTPPPLPEEPAAPPSEPPELGDPLAPEPPELGTTNEVPPVQTPPEPIPSVDTQATMDPIHAGADAFEPLTPEPASPEPEPPPPEEPTFTPVESPNEPPSLDVSPPPSPPSPEPPTLEPEPSPGPHAAPMMGQSAETASISSEPSAASGTTADDDLVERVAQRVVDKLSSKVIQEIAWEVVPDLAEGLIRREIDLLKSKIPKSG